jgi:integrase/recombinase XerD
MRWLQDVRRYQPSTVTHRLSVVVGFYRVAVAHRLALAHGSGALVRMVRRPLPMPRWRVDSGRWLRRQLRCRPRRP